MSGSATISDLGNGKTRVVVLLSDLGTHPAAIYDGTCSTLSTAAARGLHELAAGSSATDVNRSFDELVRDRTAIAVAKSRPFETPIACGNLALPPSGSPT